MGKKPIDKDSVMLLYFQGYFHMKSMSKIALGTAQFGLQRYGILNKAKAKRKEIFNILDLAKEKSVKVIDTAYGYGESEALIGEYIANTNTFFDVVSKFPDSHIYSIDYFLNTSLNRLHIKCLYGFLFHDFKSFQKKPQILNILKTYQKKGVIKKIGFSLYHPYELDYLIKKGVNFDIIQVPYNLLDQRFSDYFPYLKKIGVEIHVRSIFLQGLLLMDRNKLKGKFLKIKSKLMKISEISQESGISIPSICLNFVSLNRYVDKIVIGLSKREHLERNLRTLEETRFVKKNYRDLKLLTEEDENIIIPTNWK